ncbi:MAG: tetratricopeptide repeat protein [Candidatus Altiarchaeota archaeon]
MEVLKADEKPVLPALKTVHGTPLTEHDLVSLSYIANMNNCVLEFIESSNLTLKGKAYRVEEKIAPGGLTYTTMRVAKDLTAEEYEQLTEAINPKYKGRPIEEILVEEGLRSLLQIKDSDVGGSVFTLGEPYDMMTLSRGFNILKLKVDGELGDNAKKVGNSDWMVTTTKGQTWKIRYFEDGGGRGEVLVYERVGDSDIERRRLTGVERPGYPGTVDVYGTEEPERLMSIRSAIAEARFLLHQAEFPEMSIRAKAEKQANAMQTLQDSFRENMSQTVPSIEKIKECPSPRRTLHALDTVCEQDSALAYALLEAIRPDNSSMETHLAKVMVNYQGVGAGHTCVLCRLADGSHFLFDPNQPESSGRILQNLSYKKPERGEPAIVDLLPEERGVENSERRVYHRKLELLHPLDYNLSSQHLHLGMVHHSQEKPEEALREYNKALEICPSSVEAIGNVAIYHLQKGDTRMAIDKANEALRVNPRFAGGYHIIGLALSEEGDLDGAIREYSRSLEIEPEQATVYYNLGRAYHKTDRTGEAVIAYQNFLKYCPEDELELQRKKAKKFIEKHKRK